MGELFYCLTVIPFKVFELGKFWYHYLFVVCTCPFVQGTKKLRGTFSLTAAEVLEYPHTK